MANQEKTFWRDERISQWHRTIGNNAPATDIDTIVATTEIVDDGYDFNMLEYTNGEPVALIDYKSGGWKYNSNIAVQARFATRAGLPSFLVEYGNDMTEFVVYPTNEFAKKKLPVASYAMNEETFTKFLYLLRGVKAPAEIINRIRNKNGGSC